MNRLSEQLGRLQALAARWRVVKDQPEAATQTQSNYLEMLETLLDGGLSGGVGFENEIPDQYLPVRYIELRSRQLSELEDELAQLAQRYRSSQSDSAANVWIRRYHEVYERMCEIGHWLGVPEPDAELPDELMPAKYHERCAELVRQHRIENPQS